MRPNLKRELVEQLNTEFEKLLAKKERAKYGKYIRETSEKIIDKRPKNRIEMQKIIRQQKLDTMTATKMFNVLANTTALIMNPPKDLEQQKKLQPLQQIMRAYSVTSPRTFANSVYQMTTGRNMSQKNERFRPAMLSYYDGFTENIETADQQYQRALERSTLEAESAIFKDFEDLRRERVPIAKQKTLLLEKYGSPVRVQRILETELHEQSERTKLETSKFMQYTHKEWNTQRDERVRVTKFHTIVDRKRIPIDSNFKGGGHEAEYPGDIKLPPGERINCRCYIVYFNDPKEKVKRSPVIVPPTVIAEEPGLVADPRRYTPQENKTNAISYMKKRTKNVKNIDSISTKINETVVTNTANSLGDLFTSNKVFRKYDLRINVDGFFGGTASYKNQEFEPDSKKTVSPQISLFTNALGGSTEELQKDIKKNIESGFYMPVDEDKELSYYTEHEIGHFVQMKVLTENHYIHKVDEGKKLYKEYQEIDNELEGIDEEYEIKFQEIKERANAAGKSTFADPYLSELTKNEKEQTERKSALRFRKEDLNNEIILSSAGYYKEQAIAGVRSEDPNTKIVRDNTSEYGMVSDKEFFAEHFAAYRLNKNPNPLTKSFGRVVERALNDSIE